MMSIHPMFNYTAADVTNYNMIVQELNETSERYDGEINCQVQLKEHQRTILCKCIELENKPIQLQSIESAKDLVTDQDTFHTKIGILGDRVGSGKSYVLLSLIQENKLQDRQDYIYKTCGMDMVLFKLHDQKKAIKTTLLVIPHNLITQWEEYATQFPILTTLTINKKVFEEIRKKPETINDYDLVIVTSTYYNKLADFMNEKKHDCKFSRVIYDEVDNLNISTCRKVDAIFVWLVTASYGNLLYPKGFCKYDSYSSGYVWYANGIRYTGFVKNLVMNLWECVPGRIARLLIVKNSEAYIEKSITLSPCIKNIILCKTPTYINVLNGLIDKNVIECLNADDIQGAMSYLSPNHKSSEDNIIDLMMKKYSNNLTNLQLRLTITESLIYDSQADKENEIKKITDKIKHLETVITLMKERITAVDMCNICYNDLENKTIIKCCQNSFCFKCICMWINKQPVCPMCKAKLDYKNDLYVVSNDVGNGASTSTCCEKKTDVNTLSIDNDKYENLRLLLANRGDKSKFLIFSNFDHPFQNIHKILDQLRIKYEHLKGNAAVIRSIINNYKGNDVDVLLVNSKHYGSGLNLENTTDIVIFHKFDSEIEKQIIGRADRFGRTSPLNIWYLLHKNEHSS